VVEMASGGLTRLIDLSCRGDGPQGIASNEGTTVGVGVLVVVMLLLPSCFALLSPQVQVVPSAPMAAANDKPPISTAIP